jgi:two-component system, NarL family, nitrate/nitrite response regulator NarL
MFGSQSPTLPDKVTVLVADATPMDCQLVSEAIQRHNHFRVIDRVVSSSQTISAVRKAQPDVAVISARLQDGAFAGLLALRGLRAFPTRSRIVVVLDSDDRELVVEAFLNNARGVFCRIGSSGELRKCVQSVHNGEIWVNNNQIQYLVDALMLSPARAGTSGKATTVLSKREKEVARLVATGLSNRDISDKLGLSPHTVKNCLSRIFEKVGISTRIELVLYILSQPGPSEAASDPTFDIPARQIA